MLILKKIVALTSYLPENWQLSEDPEFHNFSQNVLSVFGGPISTYIQKRIRSTEDIFKKKTIFGVGEKSTYISYMNTDLFKAYKY